MLRHVRSRFQPSWNRCRNSAGAAQIRARPVTSRNGATRESLQIAEVGLNEASAITMTVQTATPRNAPNSPPKTRSNQRNPTPLTAQRAIRPATPPSSATTRKIVKNPAISAAHCGIHVPHVPRRPAADTPMPPPDTRRPLPPRRRAHRKNPCADCTQQSTTTTISRITQSRMEEPISIRCVLIRQGRPVSCVYASMYFSLVLCRNLRRRAGAGGCLFHLIDSR